MDVALVMQHSSRLDERTGAFVPPRTVPAKLMLSLSIATGGAALLLGRFLDQDGSKSGSQSLEPTFVIALVLGIIVGGGLVAELVMALIFRKVKAAARDLGAGTGSCRAVIVRRTKAHDAQFDSVGLDVAGLPKFFVATFDVDGARFYKSPERWLELVSNEIADVSADTIVEAKQDVRVLRISTNVGALELDIFENRWAALYRPSASRADAMASELRSLWLERQGGRAAIS